MKEASICIREALATAVNTPDLSPDGRAVDVIGALGAAAHNRYFDATDGRTKARLSSTGIAEINPRRRIASLLERAKYGLDRSAVKPAIALFVEYLRHRSEYAHWRVGSGDALLVRFASSVIFEWLHDRCAQCGGGGQIALGPIIGRNTRTRACGLCSGKGTSRVDHHARGQALHLEHATYERHWLDRFQQAHAWLRAIEESNIAPLRSQLKRGSVSTSSE